MLRRSGARPAIERPSSSTSPADGGVKPAIIIRVVVLPEPLAEMVAASPHVAWRQLAAVDLKGGVAAHTGKQCTDAKGEAAGTGVIAVGNGLANARVVPAILAG